jgi:hypothetical protein
MIQLILIVFFVASLIPIARVVWKDFTTDDDEGALAFLRPRTRLLIASGIVLLPAFIPMQPPYVSPLMWFFGTLGLLGFAWSIVPRAILRWFVVASMFVAVGDVWLVSKVNYYRHTVAVRRFRSSQPDVITPRVTSDGWVEWADSSSGDDPPRVLDNVRTSCARSVPTSRGSVLVPCRRTHSVAFRRRATTTFREPFRNPAGPQ